MTFIRLTIAILVGLGLCACKPHSDWSGVISFDVDAHAITNLDRFPYLKRSVLAQQLQFVHGLKLTTHFEAFGGLSGLHLSPDGLDMLAITDTGHWFKAKPVWREGQLVALANASMAPVLRDDGRSLRAAGHGDTEALTVGALGSYTADESYGSSIFFAPDVPASLTTAVLPFKPHKLLKGLPKGRGIEALAYIDRQGLEPMLLAIAERNPLSSAKTTPAWLLPVGRASDEIHDLQYEPTAGFDVSDAVFSRKCGLFVLERKFNYFGFFQIQLKSIDPATVSKGNVLKGLTLLSADSWTTHIDNMEGVSVIESKDGTCDIFLISDGNFMIFQSNTLLQFKLLKAV